MNLYLLSQDENDYYDTFDSMIVAAETQAEAIKIHPEYDPTYESFSNMKKLWTQDYSAWASDPKNVTCQLIGKLDKDYPEFDNHIFPIICASYNAG